MSRLSRQRTLATLLLLAGSVATACGDSDDSALESNGGATVEGLAGASARAGGSSSGGATGNSTSGGGSSTRGGETGTPPGAAGAADEASGGISSGGVAGSAGDPTSMNPAAGATAESAAGSGGAAPVPLGKGSCCAAHASSGCGDAAVQACVCNKDPECCTSNWDNFCVLLATLSTANGSCGTCPQQ